MSRDTSFYYSFLVLPPAKRHAIIAVWDFCRAVDDAVDEVEVEVDSGGVTGKEAEHLLDEIGITVNKNGIPYDPLPPNTASGIRLGTPATTSRGFGEGEMRSVGRIIIEAIRSREDESVQRRLAGEVAEIVARFHVPGLPAA